MVMTEDARFALARKLDRVLGREDAVTLLESLPPARDRVATGRDIVRVEDRLDRLEDRMDRLEDRMDRLDDRMTSLERTVHQQFRTTIFALIASNTTLAGLAFAAARIV
jgi:predicted nuclease with TOPRIM domain